QQMFFSNSPDNRSCRGYQRQSETIPLRPFLRVDQDLPFCLKDPRGERSRAYCAVPVRLLAVRKTLGEIRPSRRFSEVITTSKTAWSLHYNPTISRSETETAS